MTRKEGSRPPLIGILNVKNAMLKNYPLSCSALVTFKKIQQITILKNRHQNYTTETL